MNCRQGQMRSGNTSSFQEQMYKDKLVCPHCNNYSVVRFGNYVITIYEHSD
ncbi:hypothetical protein GNP95_05240 [Paenibacillus woosongensis]|uniref:Uncharacterized protein n=1 Tax=Paenibacillus woosongensis TaxID=307580 RepID=A0A7X2YYK7_9BACL|nr:hypothetical protein [Paenibacillus woosongensis]